MDQNFSKRDHLRGLGLRPHHYEQWLKAPPPSIFYLEAISENYLGHKGGPALYYLQKIKEKYTLLLHGVGLNIGAAEPLDKEYLKELKKLIELLNPRIISDHLSFSALDGKHSHSLLPLPRNAETLQFVAKKISQVQNELGRNIAFENISRYISYHNDDLSEMEFTSEILNLTGAKLLLDVNNLYVTCTNTGQDPYTELSYLNHKHVAQYHIAGHENHEDYLYDTHSGAIDPSVWELLDAAIAICQEAPIILEQDDHHSLETAIQYWDKDPQNVRRSRKFERDAKIHVGNHAKFALPPSSKNSPLNL